MTKLCPRGKAAAKRKFKVYPSAYANAYASKICAGKIKDPSGVKRKDFKGRKPAMGGGMMNRTKFDKGGGADTGKIGELKSKLGVLENKVKRTSERLKKRTERAGGGLMEATSRLKRQGLGMGGSVCKIAKRGQNRDAVGKNS